MKTLKLASFNINGVRKRLPVLRAWLDAAAPDIVCLQELKATDAAFPGAELRAAGYGAVWHGQATWNGVAILARGNDPLISRRGLPGDPADPQSRYIEAAAHGLLVGCLYLPNGNPRPGPKFEYKLAWFERLLAHAEGLCNAGFPAILAGDYNVVPTDSDIYDTRSWRTDALLQPEPRACFQRMLAQGWTDALRTRHPEARLFTFWDYFRQHWQRNAGLRIDHLLLSADLAPRLVDAGVDAWVRGLEGASDHAPVWITLDTRAAKPAKRAAQPARPPAKPAKRAATPAKPPAKPAKRAAQPAEPPAQPAQPVKRAARTAKPPAKPSATEKPVKKAAKQPAKQPTPRKPRRT